MRTLQWILFREWLPEDQRQVWEVPQCPNCRYFKIRFESGGPIEVACKNCSATVYLSDSLRLYERIDDEQGAGGIMAYLLTTLEQLVIVNIIRQLLDLKPFDPPGDPPHQRRTAGILRCRGADPQAHAGAYGVSL